MKGTDDDLLVFDEEVDINAFIAASAAGSGTYKLQGTLRYQACDSVRCLFPRELNFEFEVKVLP